MTIEPRRVFSLFAILLCIVTVIHAGQHQPQNASTYRTAITVKVFDESGSPIESPVPVRLLSDGISSPFVENLQSGMATFTGMAPGHYEAQVVVAGYQLGKTEFEVPENQIGAFEADLRLTKEPLEASVLGPDTTLLVPKARKDLKRGFQALKAGDLRESAQQLEAAYKLAPRDPDVNFLMGSLYVAVKDFEKAKNYFLKASWLDSRHVPSLVALGQLLSEQGNFTQAASFLKRAVSLDRKQWLAHLLLANIYFGQHNYMATQEEAEQAVHWGQDGAVSGDLLLGLSRIQLGDVEEALQPLERFAQDRSNESVSRQAQQLLATVRKDKAEGTTDAMAQADSIARGLPQLIDIPKLQPSLPSWVPSSIDDESPVVDTGVPCPIDRILDGTSRSVEQFFASIGNFTATETLTHQRLDAVGQPVSEEDRKFDYLAFTRPGMFSFDEYRNGTVDLTQFPAHIATQGFSGLEVIFHPKLRDNYQMSCEGLGQLRGKSTWIVHFQQRNDRPSLLQRFQVDGISRSIDMKGRAWISADNFQVLQIETDMVKPVPQVHLLAEREFVEYRPVQFRTPAVELWLPSSVEIYLDFRGKHYRRIDNFSDYKMFSVQTSEVIEPPKKDQ